MTAAIDIRSHAASTAAHPGAYSDELADLPTGSVMDGSRARRPVLDEADFVIVGSGASGATTAVQLSEAGYSVVILEEGAWVRTRDFTEDLYGAMTRMFRGMGTNVMEGQALTPILQGACVGGSTTINSAIAWRAPEDVLGDWGNRFGIAETVSVERLAPHYDVLEHDLNVSKVSNESVGANSSLLGDAAAALGMESHRIQRYDAGCEGSSACLTGCRGRKKLGMNITYIPRSLHAGARIYTSARVARVELRGGRAVGVHATLQGPLGPQSLFVRARRGVFIAASTIQTPNLLRRSGVRADALGRHFQAHPGVSMAGRFEQRVNMDFGAAQGWNSLHLLKSHRIKLESLMLPPELAAARTPGFGPEMMRRMGDYGHMAIWAVVVRSEAEGRVSELFGADRVRFGLTEEDLRRARHGMKVLGEMMFAVGAREVWPGVHGLPSVLRTPDELRVFDDAPLDQRAYNFMSSHLFGAARMGPDPRTSVVAPDFQVHGTRGLYVVDSSLFPTNLGVNPQHTIMAIARMAARQVAARPHAPV